MSINKYSVSESDASETNENTYCILLHIVEGIGLTLKECSGGAGGDLGNQRKNIFLLKVSLNGVQFEVEGHSLTPESAAIFNNNCIWECGLDDIKRMKTDNRPVKLECFLKYGRSKNSASKMIGSLLLPIRGVKTINNLTQSQLKFFWHKLGTLSAEWRQNRPEIYLMLIIVKKDIIEHGELEALLGKHKRSSNVPSNSNVMLSPTVSETVFMLQSQSNVYVQLLEQFGQIQVGNNPADCEIFSVTLTFKQVKNVIGLLGLAQPSYQSHGNSFVFQYDFFGSISNVEIIINPIDCYTINEKIALSFRSSLNSLRLYFQRIFYIPINLYYNDAAVANYLFDFSKLLPDEAYFINVDRLWTKNGSFNFERLHKILSPKAFKPSVDFIFSIQLVIPCAKRNNYETAPSNETFASTEQLCGNMHQNLDMPHVVQAFKQMPFDICMTDRHLNRFETYDDPFQKYDLDIAADLCAKSATEFLKDDATEKDELKCHSSEYSVQNKTNNVYVLTEPEPQKTFSSIATNTDTCDIKDHEELTIQIVQELEDWKSQQMENFINELKRKEKTHLKDLQTHWEQQRVVLEAQLKDKMVKCDQLNAQLEKAQMELNASAIKNREAIIIADTIKRDIEFSYAKKFNELETDMQGLKLEIQQRSTMFELKNKQILFDNTCLELEKAELKERTEQLEKQLTMLQNTHLSADQINDVHNDMVTKHKQMERCVAMEKSRNFYKEQWEYASQKVNKLKVKLLKVREVKCERKTLKNAGFEFCLDDILNEEQEILKSDRSELRSIQLSLLSSSDSSPDELVSERLT